MSQLSGRCFNFENKNKFQVHEQGLQAGFDRRGHRGVRRVERLLRQPGEDQDHVCRRQLNILSGKEKYFSFLLPLFKLSYILYSTSISPCSKLAAFNKVIF